MPRTAVEINQESQNIYDSKWEIAQSSFATNKIDRDIIPQAGSLRWGVGLVFFLDGESKAILNALANKLKKDIGGKQLTYQPGQIHTTIFTFEPFRSDINREDKLIKEYIQIVNQAIEGSSSFTIDYHGLSATKGNIFAQGFIRDQVVDEIRRKVLQAMLDKNFNDCPEYTAPRKTVHANLLAFTDQPKDLSKGVEVIQANKDQEFGSMEVNSLHLVRCIRTAYAVEIESLKQFSL